MRRACASRSATTSSYQTSRITPAGSRPFDRPLGFCQLPQFRQHRGHIAVRLGIVWLDKEGTFEPGYSCRQLTLLLECDAEVAMGCREFWGEGERLLIVPRRRQACSARESYWPD
jgi:hypothetical protein